MTDGGPVTGPRERSGGGEIDLRSRLVRVVFLEADRRYVASLLTVGIFLSCLGLVWAGYVPLEDTDSVKLLVSSLIGGMLPFITVVLAIVQLILSQEFGSTGTFQDRLERTEAFRKQVERHANVDVSPVDPEQFLAVLLEAISERGGELASICDEDQPSADGRLREFATDLVSFSEGEQRRLRDAGFDSFRIVSVLLEYNDSALLHATRRLKAESEFDHPPAAEEVLDEIEALLEDVHVTRQYFKTVRVQQELANLSRLLLYVGFPALVGGGFFVLAYDALVAMDLGPIVLSVLTSAVVTLSFAPFTVLLAYVLRIATIARRTAADFGPFHLQQKPLYD